MNIRTIEVISKFVLRYSIHNLLIECSLFNIHRVQPHPSPPGFDGQTAFGIYFVIRRTKRRYPEKEVFILDCQF